jgi:hypothetical protein
MAANILSSDFLVICLLMANGETVLSLEEVALAVENFQNEEYRYFGVWPGDFRGMLSMLVYQEPGLGTDLSGIALNQVIPLILDSHDVHTNDSDTYWSKYDDGDLLQAFENLEIEKWNGYSLEEYSDRLELRQRMKEFFSTGRHQTPGQVMEFLKMNGINEEMIYHCLV